MRTIRIATTAAEIDRCFPVMHQLRPALFEIDFIRQVQLQQAEGYQLACVEFEQAIVAVAGFRLQSYLHSGRTLYVDDLVTDGALRSQGHGEALLKWLIELAREAGCTTFSLDSGSHRKEAHAFYFRNGLRISSFHFELPL